jgi:zinc transporter, ZIP family
MSATGQTARSERVPLWLAGVVPLALIALLIAGFVILNPIAGLREVPPVEAVAVERTVITDSGIELHVRNDGPDPVRIAQVLVNDAYRDFEITGSDPELRRLESAVIELDYPWETGLPLTFGLVTSTGVSSNTKSRPPPSPRLPTPRRYGSMRCSASISASCPCP